MRKNWKKETFATTILVVFHFSMAQTIKTLVQFLLFRKEFGNKQQSIIWLLKNFCFEGGSLTEKSFTLYRAAALNPLPKQKCFVQCLVVSRLEKLMLSGWPSNSIIWTFCGTKQMTNKNEHEKFEIFSPEKNGHPATLSWICNNLE